MEATKIGQVRPSNELDRKIMRRVIADALRAMGTWTSRDGRYSLSIDLPTGSVVGDNGTIMGQLTSVPVPFDPQHILDGPDGDVNLGIELHSNGDPIVVWTFGHQSNWVQPNCWILA